MKFFALKSSIFTIFVFALCSSVAFAQNSTEINRSEVFVGYSFFNSGLFNNDEAVAFSVEKRGSAHGINASYARNFHRYIGAKVDYSYHRGDVKPTGPNGTDGAGIEMHQLVAGIQLKENKKNGWRFKPFGHAMIGVGSQTIDFRNLPGCVNCKRSSTGFATVLGAGVDLEVNEHIDVRVIQFDYNTFSRNAQNDAFFGTIPGRTEKNARISIGVVFH
ncbi:MAG: outer membrane beta-barrel protein [Pyrinomonadaceae bacterium]